MYRFVTETEQEWTNNIHRQRKQNKKANIFVFIFFGGGGENYWRNCLIEREQTSVVLYCTSLKITSWDHQRGSDFEHTKAENYVSFADDVQRLCWCTYFVYTHMSHFLFLFSIICFIRGGGVFILFFLKYQVHFTLHFSKSRFKSIILPSILN